VGGGDVLRRSPSSLLVAAVLLVSLAVTVLAARRAPWDPDETRYLQVTHEMLERGNPFLLTFGGEPYSDKPPLFFWLLAPAVALLGPRSAVAGILPSLLAYLLLPVALARLGRAMSLAPFTASWGALLTATALLPALLAGGCRMDLLFTLLVTVALAHLVRALDGERAAGRRFWLWTGLAVLAKGPLAVALPLLAAAPALLHDRGARRAVLAPSAWLPGLGVIASWLVPAAIMGGREWLLATVVHQSAGRMVASFAHREPWWYHLATLPGTLLPWSPLVLVALIRLLTQPHALRGGPRVVVYFPVATVAFLSLLSGKTLLYPLPMFPAACLVTAHWLAERPPRLAGRLALAAGGLLGLALAAGLAFWVAPHPDFRLEGPARWMPAVAVAAPALAALVLALGELLEDATRALALVVPAFAVAALPVVGTGFDRLLSLEPLGEAYLAAMPPGQGEGVAYGRLQPGYLLFTGMRFRLVATPAALESELDAGRVVVGDARAFAGLPERVRATLETVAEIPYRHSRLLIVRRGSPDRGRAPAPPPRP